MSKRQDKNLNILKIKRAFKMKLKAFFFIFEGLSLHQIKFFLKGESPTLLEKLSKELDTKQRVKKLTSTSSHSRKTYVQKQMTTGILCH